MASAVNADHADTADTASDALKLGGYDASDYLRKDEVQTVTAAYQEIEWTSPGTYNWVVPEGVNSILVTTVGGGGGFGFFQYYNQVNKRYLIFPGGSGGEVVANKLVETTPGETLQIVVGNAGSYPQPINNGTDSGSFDENSIKQRTGTAGGDGGISYIARNGTMISETKARGGAGGAAQWYYSEYKCLYNSATGAYDKSCGNWYRSYTAKNTTTATTKYRGGHAYYGQNYNNRSCGFDSAKGISGYSGMGGNYNEKVNNSGYWSNQGSWRSAGNYYNMGGGGSWGDGASGDRYGTGRAGTGGGGMHYSDYGVTGAGYGMVRILAIGITYDE